LVLLVLAQVVLGSTALFRSHRDEFAWRDVAVRSTSLAVSEYVDFHGRALKTLAERFGGWEAIPPEAAERALLEVQGAHPALRRVFLVDARGSAVAQVGGPERAFASPPAADKAPIRITAAAVGGDWLEILVPVPKSRGYVGAELATDELGRLLEDLTRGGGVGLVLEAAGVSVVPRGAELPTEAWHYDLGAGLALHVTFQPVSTTGTGAAALTAVLLSGLMATALVLLVCRL
jgi:hypothetical protein